MAQQKQQPSWCRLALRHSLKILRGGFVTQIVLGTLGMKDLVGRARIGMGEKLVSSRILYYGIEHCGPYDFSKWSLWSWNSPPESACGRWKTKSEAEAVLAGQWLEIHGDRWQGRVVAIKYD